MRILALDPSERACGYACWGEDDGIAAIGHWVLGSEYTDSGTVFARLHENMTDLSQLGQFDFVFYEKARHLDGWNQHSNANSHLIMVGLNAHVLSWCAAMGSKPRVVNMTTWRRHFLGKMNRAGKTEELKRLAMERARQLGFRPRVHDEAEALGILDYACDELRVMPPWRADEVLRPALGGVA